MSDFSEAVERLSNYDPSTFLGRLCWYVVTEDSYVDHAEFCRSLISNNLNDHLPPAPRASDVFKRSCTAAQVKRVPTAQPTVFVNYLIREVGKDPDNIWRRLVAETVDTEGRTLGYEEVAELHFFRPTQKITIKPMVATLDPAADAVIAEVENQFLAWNNTLTPYAVRELIRKILRGFNATVLRDGVYFVREVHAEKVDALEAIVAILPGGSNFHSLPLLDDRKQRLMLKQAFEDESIGEVDRLLGEMRTVMTQPTAKITSDRFADFKLQYDALRSKVADYSDLLDEAMENTASRLEILNQAIFEIMGRIKV